MVSMSFFMLLSILIIITLNSPINYPPPFQLVLLLENFFVLSLGSYLSIFPFWLPLCACFYVLDRSANSGADQSQTLLVSGPGQPVWGYQRSTAPSAGPGYVQKNKTEHQAWLLPAPGSGEGKLKVQSSQRSSSARFSVGLISECLPAALFSSRT